MRLAKSMAVVNMMVIVVIEVIEVIENENGGLAKYTHLENDAGYSVRLAKSTIAVKHRGGLNV